MENKEKNGKGKNIVIVFLVLIILGLSGYIVYDKFFKKEEKENKENIKAEEKVKEPTLLTNDDALNIGKELYIKTRDIAYNHGVIANSEKMTIDTNNCYSNENGSMTKTTCDDFTFNKVLDNSFKENFTAKGLQQYEESAVEFGGGGFAIYNNEYYIKPYKWGPFNGPYDIAKTKITVKEINENTITLEATETFGDETINTTFTIAKINNQWKMDDYTDAAKLMWSKYLVQ